MMQERITTSGIWVKNKKIFIAKRDSEGAVGGLWEFPGGKRRHDESPQEALVREYKEELDLDIVVGEKIFEHDFVNNDTLYHLYVYLISVPNEHALPKIFHTDFKWVSIEELSSYDMVPSDKACIPTIIKKVQNDKKS